MSLKVAGWKLHKRSFFGGDLGKVIGPNKYWSNDARLARLTRGWIGPIETLWMTRADFNRMEELLGADGRHQAEVLLKALLAYWEMEKAWAEFASANKQALEVSVSHLHHPEKNEKRPLMLSDGFPFTNEEEKRRKKEARFDRFGHDPYYEDPFLHRLACRDSNFSHTADYELVRPELYGRLRSYVDEFSVKADEAKQVIYKARSLADSFIRDHKNREKLRSEMLIGVDTVAGEKALRKLDASITDLGLEHIQKLDEERELEQKAYTEGAKRWRELNS